MIGVPPTGFHFFMEARKKDMFCQLEFKSSWVSFSKICKTMETGLPFSDYARHYRLFITLALSGKRTIASMNRLRKRPICPTRKIPLGSYLPALGGQESVPTAE